MSIKPTLALNFAKSKYIDPRILFSRIDTYPSATFINDLGFIEVVENNTPRLQFDIMTGKCLGVLIEESRENKCYPCISPANSTGTWLLGTGVSATPNFLKSPDGNQNATKYSGMTGNSISGSGTTLKMFFSSITGNYTPSFYAKGAIGGETVSVRIVSDQADSGNIACLAEDGANNTLTTEFRRYYLNVGNAGTITNVHVVFVFSGTGDKYIWGGQLENGSFLTSLIKTTSGVSVRGNEILRIDGTSFSSFYNQTQGTFVVFGTSQQNSSTIINIGESDANTNNSTNCNITSGNTLNFATYNAGSLVQSNSFIGKITPKNNFVAVMAIKSNDFINATFESELKKSATGTLSNAMAKLEIGSRNVSNFLNGTIHAVLYYNTVLSDTDIKNIINTSKNTALSDTSIVLDFFRHKNLHYGLTYNRNDSSGTYISSNGTLTVASTNQPRFDHHPTSLLPLGILMEETATNLAIKSEIFSDAAWGKYGSGSVVDNNLISPMGTNTAALITNSSGYYIQQNISLGGTALTAVSVFLKAGTCSSITISNIKSGSSTETSDVTFNVFSGAITSGSNGSIHPYSNGWYRCSVLYAGTNPSNSTNSIKIAPNQIGNFYIFGAQIEQNALTSYIRTDSTVKTRAQDLLVMSGSYFSNWYNFLEGTFLVEAEFSSKSTSTAPRIFQATNDSNEEQISMYADVSNSKIISYVVDNDIEQFNSSSNNNYYTNKTPFKSIISYKNNTISCIMDDYIPVTDNVASLPTPTILRIGAGTSGTNPWNGHIKYIKYYPRALSVQEQKNII